MTPTERLRAAFGGDPGAQLSTGLHSTLIDLLTRVQQLEKSEIVVYGDGQTEPLLEGRLYSFSDGHLFLLGTWRRAIGTNKYFLAGSGREAVLWPADGAVRGWTVEPAVYRMPAPTGLRRVFVASPLRPKAKREDYALMSDKYFNELWNCQLADNQRHAERLCRAVVDAGYVPYAPHLFFPRFMDERTERERAIELASAELARCDELWFWDKPTEGMAAEILQARRLGMPIRRVP